MLAINELFVAQKYVTDTHQPTVAAHNESALTDYAVQENHVIDWVKATVTDGEPDCPTSWINESVHIRKEGQQAMNRDEGSYQLSIRPLS